MTLNLCESVRFHLVTSVYLGLQNQTHPLQLDVEHLIPAEATDCSPARPADDPAVQPQHRTDLGCETGSISKK